MADRYAAFAELVQERLALENSVAEANRRGDSWSVIQNPIIRGTTRVSECLSKSHDTPQKVIKEQRLSWKN